jgi:hypothetical protein
LYAVPILLKDNIDTDDRMLASVDSLAPNEQAARDAEVAGGEISGLRTSGRLTSNPEVILKSW